MKRLFPIFFSCVILAGTVCGNFSELNGLLSVSCKHVFPMRDKAVSELHDDGLFQFRRLIAEMVPSDCSLRVETKEPGALTAHERALVAGVVFDRIPFVTDYGLDSSTNQADFLLVSNNRRKLIRSSGMYRRICSDGEMTLFSHNSCSGNVATCSCLQPDARKELVGVWFVILPAIFAGVLGGSLFFPLAWFVLSGIALTAILLRIPLNMWTTMLASIGTMALFFFAAKCERNRTNSSISISSILCSALFAAVVIPLSLSTLAQSPGAVATIGGRAKLVSSFGCVPSGFFTDSAWSILQPAYPPGAALLTAPVFWMAGSSCDWAFQSLPAFAMTALLFIFINTATKCSQRLFIFALFFTPLAYQLTSQSYPETFALLFLVAGIKQISKGSGERMGWFVLGLAAWFKYESFIFIVLIWMIVCRNETVFRSLDRFVLACSVPFAWVFVVRYLGGGLPDWSDLSSLSLVRLRLPFKVFLNCFWLRSWEYAFAFPLGLVALVVGFASRKRGAWIVPSAFLMVSSMSFIAVYSFSEASDLQWHVLTSFPRLLWDCVIVATALWLCGPSESSNLEGIRTTRNATGRRPFGLRPRWRSVGERYFRKISIVGTRMFPGWTSGR